MYSYQFPGSGLAQTTYQDSYFNNNNHQDYNSQYNNYSSYPSYYQSYSYNESTIDSSDLSISSFSDASLYGSRPSSQPAANNESNPPPSVYIQPSISSKQAKKRQTTKRTRFSDEQRQRLEYLFSLKNYPNSLDMEQMADELGISIHTVTVWFQNQRARKKKNLIGS